MYYIFILGEMFMRYEEKQYYKTNEAIDNTGLLLWLIVSNNRKGTALGPHVLWEVLPILGTPVSKQKYNNTSYLTWHISNEPHAPKWRTIVLRKCWDNSLVVWHVRLPRSSIRAFIKQCKIQTSINMWNYWFANIDL